MGAVQQEDLHNLLDQLRITSLRESDLENGATDVANEDRCSATSGDAITVGGDETSADSVMSADVRAVLGAARLHTRDQKSLEAQLRLGRTEGALRPWRRPRPPTFAEKAVVSVPAATSTDAGLKSLRLRGGDLTISEAQYQAYLARPPGTLDDREWVLLRFHEARAVEMAEMERMRLEIDALRDSACAVQLRVERLERQLACREAEVVDLTQELARQGDRGRAQLEQVTAKLDACERQKNNLVDQGLRFDEVAQEASRLREEISSLRDEYRFQAESHERLTRDHSSILDRYADLEAEHRLLVRDAESYEKRARIAEETLTRRDEEVLGLRAKVESLREKKRELAQKAVAEGEEAAREVHDRVEAELTRLREQAHKDAEATRVGLAALHERELRLVRDRCEASEARASDLQRRLEDEEHALQQLHISSARARGELQQDIAELNGTLKLRAFEAERAMLVQEDTSNERQRLQEEAERLGAQLDVLKKEYYALEKQDREARIESRTELTALGEQLRSYTEAERELDAAIRTMADEQPAEGAAFGAGGSLLIASTLTSVPSMAKNRVHQSLLLVQELQRRNREVADVRKALDESGAAMLRLQEELEVARSEVRHSSQPQAYLLGALRHRESEVCSLTRQLRLMEAELEQSRLQMEQAVAERLRLERDPRKCVFSCQEDAACERENGGYRADHRGRAPTQLPLGTKNLQGNADEDACGQIWLQRLRAKLA